MTKALPTPWQNAASRAPAPPPLPNTDTIPVLSETPALISLHEALVPPLRQPVGLRTLRAAVQCRLRPQPQGKTLLGDRWRRADESSFQAREGGETEESD